MATRNQKQSKSDEIPASGASEATNSETLEAQTTQDTGGHSLMEKAREALEHNPCLDVVWVTTDGTCFSSENYAKNHARQIEDKRITKLERETI